MSTTNFHDPYLTTVVVVDLLVIAPPPAPVAEFPVNETPLRTAHQHEEQTRQWTIILRTVLAIVKKPGYLHIHNQVPSLVCKDRATIDSAITNKLGVPLGDDVDKEQDTY